MSEPRILVVGGGLAGLSAAVACTDAGARVTLLEARPRLGGATWSTRRAGLDIDNGQHVFLRCCDAYRGFLERLGVEDRVHLQARLDVPVLAPGGRSARLRRHSLPAPGHLAPSLLAYRHLSLGGRLRAAAAVRRLAALDPNDPAVDARRLGDWLAEQPGDTAALERFFDLLVRPILNLPAREASLALTAFVFQRGLLERPENADIGWATVPLARLHAEPAAEVLARARARVVCKSPVDALELPVAGSPAVRTRGERLEADALILATTHEEAAALLPEAAGVDRSGLRRLGRAPIVNLHVVYDRPVLQAPFVAGIDTPLEWIFDRTHSAGLENGQYLAVSLSAAEAWVGRSRENLRAVFEPALQALLPGAGDARILRFFSTCEPAATFRQGPGTRALRPGARTGAPGLFLAGAWTDTGWPATMEGAVRSGLAAARAALLASGRRHSLPAEAA